MADGEDIFDPSLKKKKKKKKPFDFDSVLDGDQDGQKDEGPTEEPAEESEKKETTKDTDYNLDEDFSLMKKKKKKKATFDLSQLDEALPPKEEVNEEADEQDTKADVDDIDDSSLNFDFSKKKKKTKKVIQVDDLAFDDGDTDKGKDDKQKTWTDTDRDYTYDELLKRVFDIMREKNPEMMTGDKKRFVMKPPQVMKAGTRKTAFSNFSEICKMLHRQPKHLLAFLLAELGTSGSLDGSNQLIIKGRFQQKQIENVLRRYIKEYVTCHTCRSPDTILQRDTRLYFLQCESCGSRCSVASIKSGFQAVTGKRAALRAKTTA